MTEQNARRPTSQRALWQALGACGLGLSILAAAAVGWRPPVPVASISHDTEVVILGSSIALANLDGPLLARALERPPTTVAQLGVRASQPAHWLATLRHQLPSQGAQVAHVVVVTPLDVLLRERLRSDADTQRLLALLSRPDPELWQVAVGAGGWASFWGRQAAGLRSWARGGLGGWLPAVMGHSKALAQARAEASAVPRKRAERSAWSVDPSAPRAGRVGDQPAQREPERVALEAWTLGPQLAQEAQSQGVQLWVVAPPMRPSERGPRCTRSRVDAAVARALGGLGVTVVDATDAPLPDAAFRTRYHLEGQGPAMLSAAVGAAMRGQPPDWMVCPIRDPAGTSR